MTQKHKAGAVRSAPAFLYCAVPHRANPVFGIVLLGDVGVGHHGVFRQSHGHVGDGVHQGVDDPAPLRFRRGGGIVEDGFPEVQRPQSWRHIQGHKGQSLAGLLIVHAPQIDEPVLEGVDDIVVLVVALGEDHQPIPVLQFLGAFPEGGQGSGVVVHPHTVGVVEHAYAEGHDEVAQELIEPTDGPGLARPEILIGIGCHLLPVHHLPGTPDPVLPGGIELHGDGAEHLAVVPRDDAGALRQVLRPRQLPLGGKEPHAVPNEPIGQRGGLVAHLLLP